MAIPKLDLVSMAENKPAWALTNFTIYEPRRHRNGELRTLGELALCQAQLPLVNAAISKDASLPYERTISSMNSTDPELLHYQSVLAHRASSRNHSESVARQRSAKAHWEFKQFLSAYHDAAELLQDKRAAAADDAQRKLHAANAAELELIRIADELQQKLRLANALLVAPRWAIEAYGLAANMPLQGRDPTKIKGR